MAAGNLLAAHCTWYGKVNHLRIFKQMITTSKSNRESDGSTEYPNENTTHFGNTGSLGSTSVNWTFSYEGENHYHPSRWVWSCLRVQWVLFSVASTAAVIVTVFDVMYFSLIRNNVQGSFAFGDLMMNGLNSIFVLIEIWFHAQPIRLWHVLFPMGYILVFWSFSLVFWAFDHRNIIYPVLLDWNRPVIPAIVGLLVIFIGSPVTQTLFYGIYCLRLFCFNKIYNHKYHEALL